MQHYRELYSDRATAALHPLIRSAEACYRSSAKADEMADRYGTNLHILHLSTARELTLFDNKPLLTVTMSEDQVKAGLNAGQLVREAAKLIQGGGGGQPHFATAGGKNPDGLSAAVDKVIELAGF